MMLKIEPIFGSYDTKTLKKHFINYLQDIYAYEDLTPLEESADETAFKFSLEYGTPYWIMDGTKRIGFCYLRWQGEFRCWELQHLSIFEPFRNKGYSIKTFEYLITTMGIKDITFYINNKNRPALKMYEKFFVSQRFLRSTGFQFSGDRQGRFYTFKYIGG